MSRPPDRLTVLRLAAAADCDPRTAAKALARGLDAVRGRPSERLAAAAPKLGLRFPPEPPTAA